MSTPDLVAALDSPGGWQRDMVQFMLVQRHDSAAIPPLVQHGRRHAAAGNPLASPVHARRARRLTPAILDGRLCTTRIRASAATPCAFREPFLKTRSGIGRGNCRAWPTIPTRKSACRSPARWANGTIRARAMPSAGSPSPISKSPIFSPAAMSSVTKKNLGRVAATVTQFRSRTRTPDAALSRSADDGDRVSQRRRADRFHRFDGETRKRSVSGLAALGRRRHARRP